MRDEFSETVKRKLAQRVRSRCSNPECGVATAGPALATTDAVNLGVAAHMTAASPDGPRFDATLNPEQRCAIDNAIWLCQTCAKLIDSDVKRYPVAILREWKRAAEDDALAVLGKPDISVSSRAAAAVERARLLDERVARVVHDFKIRGEPRTMIDTFSDLSGDEKAELFDRAYRLKKGRPPKRNPYRDDSAV